METAFVRRDADLSGVEEAVDRTLALYSAWSGQTTLAEMRSGFEALHGDGNVGGAPVDLDGMSGLAFGDEAIGQGPTVLYFHGGGYQIGSARSHAGLMERLCRASGACVVGFDYRLAPEAKFPAAVKDGLAAWRWLIGAGVDAARVAFAGDSAGGGLAVATMLAARDEGLPLPAAAVLMSPWLDMSASGESYSDPAIADPLTRTDAIKAMARACLGRDGNPRNPLASPVHADLRGLPPMLIHVGDREVVRDDSMRLASRLRERGGVADLHVWSGMVHVFQIYPEIVAGERSIAELGAFVRTATGG